MRASLGMTIVVCTVLGGCTGSIGSSEEAISTVKPLPTSITTDNPGGSATTSATSGIDLTATNGFFHNFGTNGRTCGTCHKVDQGWSFASAAIASLPANDPIFVFDGSDCLAPGQANTNPTVQSTALLRQGLIRVELPILDSADYTLTAYTDPFGCGSDPRVTKVLRLYRRPLPTANAKYLTTIMWDGREGGLPSQANDATLGHAQAVAALDENTRGAIVAFEVGSFTGQSVAGSSPPLKLDFKGGNGGADYLMNSVPFSFGINDVFSPSFTPIIFTIYQSWESGTDAPHPYAASIGRGEALFNSKPITIAGVNGLNAPAGPAPASFVGTCGSCHDTPNVGNHSVPLAIDIGLTGTSPPALDVSRLPTYTFTTKATPPVSITVTDPGRGLISGHFADLGKTKGPILRGLAARAPYFHNGSAPDLGAVVDFYNARFGIGFTAAEKADLVAFLGAL